MPNIRGLQPISLIDYPGEVAAVVFLGGCNFRCGFCHNPELVLKPGTIPIIQEQDFFNFLEKRKGKLDGIVVTGGEPCMNKDLPRFLEKIKKKEFLVKLDTNGSYPKVLEKSLPYVDYIAMDIKSGEQSYSKVVGIKVDIKKIKQSIELIKTSKKKYEFRTTVHPEFFSEDTLEEIEKLVGQIEKYSLQKFVYQENLIDPSLSRKTFNKQDMEKFEEKAKEISKRVLVR
jgi:pyruvate formate lyase activating enzyme